MSWSTQLSSNALVSTLLLVLGLSHRIYRSPESTVIFLAALFHVSRSFMFYLLLCLFS